jgi:hypothetical protein
MQLQTTCDSDLDHDALYIRDMALHLIHFIGNDCVAHDSASNINNHGPASISGSENQPWSNFSL